MLHPDTRIQYIDDDIGYGVFATHSIPKGTVVYVRDSLEIEIQESDLSKHHPSLRNEIEKYTYIDEKGVRVLSWDFAK